MDVMEFLSHFTPLSYLCFLLGIVLIIIEMSQPGISFPGILGTILLIVGVAVTAENLTEVIAIIVIIMIVLVIALVIIINSATRGTLSKNMVLHDVIDGNSVNLEEENAYYLINKEGIALSPLRPSGLAEFEGNKLDVISEGQFIEKGSRVKIIKIESLSIIVRKIKDT